jgi:hypothetical protein|tara:strand:+ start:1621 stop:1794 length:174 start_codon:yes stop_codon:yes gene_type:complete
MVKIKKATILKNYYGHDGALSKGEIVVIREITSDKIKVTDISGKFYWLNPEFIKIIR